MDVTEKESNEYLVGKLLVVWDDERDFADFEKYIILNVSLDDEKYPLMHVYNIDKNTKKSISWQRVRFNILLIEGQYIAPNRILIYTLK